MRQNEGFPWRDLAALQHVVLPERRPPDDEVRAEARDVLAKVWEGIQEVKQAVTMLESVVAPVLHELIPRFPGWAETPVGAVKRTTKGGSTSWDHEDAMADVVKAAIYAHFPMDHERGTPWAGHPDAPYTPSEALHGAAVTAAAVEKAAGLSYWRVKALKSLGLDADDYRSKSPARPWVSRV